MTPRRLLLAASGGGSFVLSAPVTYEAFNVTSPPEGGWVWFGAPRAIRSGDSTIFGYTTGNSGGDVKAAIMDNDSRAVLSTTTLYDNFLLDDHQPPSFVVRGDGIILAAFAYHVGDIYIARATAAGVLPDGAIGQTHNLTSQLGGPINPATPYGYSYATIVYLPDESKYWMFARYHDSGGHPHVVYSTSSDDGVTWATHTVLQNITYHKVAVNGTGRIDVVTSDHPFYGQNDVSGAHTSVYHHYYESGAWHKSDGTVETLPVANSGTATVVYDGTTSRGWLWDIAIDGTNPVIVFVVYDETYPSGAWHYGYARWSGSAWVVNDDIADAGSSIYNPQGTNDYAGGITIDPMDPSVVWYSSNVGGHFQIYRAVTTDGGATWTPTAMTSDTDKNVRPTAVHGHDGRVAALALYGTYDDYFNYSQGVKGFGVAP